MHIARIIENKTIDTMYTIEKLHLFSLSVFTISIFFVHSSIVDQQIFFYVYN